MGFAFVGSSHFGPSEHLAGRSDGLFYFKEGHRFVCVRGIPLYRHRISPSDASAVEDFSSITVVFQKVTLPSKIGPVVT
jgi:hypothetical protein